MHKAPCTSPHQILWREWRNTNDTTLAAQIYELVKDSPVGWPFVFFCTILGAVFFGTTTGITITALVTNATCFSDLNVWKITWPETLKFLQYTIPLCAFLGLFIGYVFKRHLWWGDWITWWAPGQDTGPLTQFIAITAILRGLAGIMIIKLIGMLAHQKWPGPTTLLVTALSGYLSVFGILSLRGELGFRKLSRLFFGLVVASGLSTSTMEVSHCIFLAIIGGISGLITRLGGMPITNLFLRCLFGSLIGLVLVGVNPFNSPPWNLVWAHLSVHAWALIVIALLLMESTPLDGLFITESQFPPDPMAARPYCFWWSNRPSPSETEQALVTLAPASWQPLLKSIEAQRRNPPPLENLVMSLQRVSWKERFLSRQVIFWLGTELIPYLLPLLQNQSTELAKETTWLIREISKDSETRFQKNFQNAICTKCYTRFEKHFVDLPGPFNAYYYGCRTCKQNRNYIQWDGKIIAVLDHAMDAEFVIRKQSLYVNWLWLNRLFDFDGVEIVQATEEEVERFIIQVRNDTDPGKQKQYKSMTCRIINRTALTQETINLLENVFGSVIFLQDVICPPGSKT